MKMGSRWTNWTIVASLFKSRGMKLIKHWTKSGFGVESKVKSKLPGFPCRVHAPAALTLQQRDVLLSHGSWQCARAIPHYSRFLQLSALLVAAAFAYLGWTDNDEEGSQLLHHFQGRVLSARSGPQATTWTTLKVWGALVRSKPSRSPGCRVYGLMKWCLSCAWPPMPWKAVRDAAATFLHLQPCCSVKTECRELNWVFCQQKKAGNKLKKFRAWKLSEGIV